MKNDLLTEIRRSLDTGFIDKTKVSDYIYQPELLLNSKQPPTKVLSTIISKLNSCIEFYISVAFVTSSGVATLINTLKELQQKGVKGKILVSQYLNFTEPEALKKLKQFDNIELKILTKEDSHSKGYIFKYTDSYDLIIGSSNLTANALSTNKEWNLKVSALPSSQIVDKVLTVFTSDFELAVNVTDAFILYYENIYRQSQLSNNFKNYVPEYDQKIEPNLMQKEALHNIDLLRKRGQKKALLISATGTGKTYLSAFDAKELGAKKLLFVVHRLNIAEKSMESYKKIFGKSKTMGLFSGNKKDLDRDFIFSTVQTISKQENLSLFNNTDFDYIIIDESHRSGASSYKRLLNYFEPKFLLGMTATPERTDGEDIFSAFDHNIAYEIRLKQAIEEEMLCQFHYYGVSDLTVDGISLDDTKDFNKLVSKERIDNIIKTVKCYGTFNGITRGLVFCSRNKEAEELSDKFNELGFKTVALSGKNSEDERANAIERLESEDINIKLDYIFTVDIFNEGIDIPNVNQILMIRPTESAIIFVQQLGRGLRKVLGKSYLTVIDFIGNYNNNYLIPIALYGDTSFNKDSLRRIISEGSKTIPGASTVNFDKITKEKIYESINTSNLQLLSDLRKDYNLLKYKLGHTPLMMDFIEHGSRNPFAFVEHSKSYFNFIEKVDNKQKYKVSEEQKKLLELFGLEINNSKRVEESIIMKKLIALGSLNVKDFKDFIYTEYKYSVTNESIHSCLNNLNFGFIRDKKDKKLIPIKDIYNIEVLTYNKNEISLSSKFSSHLGNPDFKTLLKDSIDYSIHIFNKHFELDNWNSGFQLYKKYSRKDVFRILNVEINPVAQNVGGYLVDVKNGHCPIFVNYHKDDNISESIKYEDEFINNKQFNWMSKSNRKLDSKDVKAVSGKLGPMRLPLFIKKSNDEGKDFYYMGDATPDENQFEQTTIKNNKGKDIPIVRFFLNLDDPVTEEMYNYLRENFKHIEEEIQQKTETPLIENYEPILDFDKKQLIPLYDFYAAAGSFSEMQSCNDYQNIVLMDGSIHSNFFACKVLGESMNRTIPNGSICLFEKYNGGSRDSKIILIEQFGYYDPDFRSSFTVKTYTSEKEYDLFGNWIHKSIVLKPNSHDSSFQDIVLNEESATNMRSIGIFKKVLGEEDYRVIDE